MAVRETVEAVVVKGVLLDVQVILDNYSHYNLRFI